MNAYAAALRRGFEEEIARGEAMILQPADSAFRSRSGRKLAAASHRYVWLPGRLRSCSATVIHLLDQSYAHLIPGIADRPLVVTCHDLIPLSEPIRSIGAWLYRRNIANLATASRVIAISVSTRTQLVDRIGIDPERIEVLPHGIDERFFAVRWAGRMDPMRVLHVGSNASYKRVGSLLKSPERELLRLGGVPLTEFGWVTDEGLPDIYARASVLLHPSSHEGQGKPVVEAMAVGLPVVASSIPAFHEIGGDLLALVEGDDPTDYASSINSLRADEFAKKERAEGGRAVARKYRWESHVSRLREIYAEVGGA